MRLPAMISPITATTPTSVPEKRAIGNIATTAPRTHPPTSNTRPLTPLPCRRRATPKQRTRITAPTRITRTRRKTGQPGTVLESLYT
ncbi:hypothetical protein AV530_019873 [Patagioenas fasciata monilis]|uniref:Uncharacterized protein n=1 Tax=Patagioenas fasciata monilis TaxID=372326 RepID=A0A1V4KFF9_PATFA|nr:hypothetical protein AV530_019873 [Patagioenas fasciata monilis]